MRMRIAVKADYGEEAAIAANVASGEQAVVADISQKPSLRWLL
jgi:hypothetical protein